MNKFFKFSFLLLLFNQIIFCEQELSKKMLLVNYDVDTELLESQYCGDGFLEGTLVKTIAGYIPIEQIQVGDILVGFEGIQEVLSVKKGKVDRYVRLFLMNGDYIHAAIHQDFFLADETRVSAADLSTGDRLLNGLYIVDSEFIEQPCHCYSLTTEHHLFFISSDVLVHNYNPVVVGALGSFIIGAVEVFNPVTVMLGVIVPLSLYAVQYFRSNIVYTSEFEEKDINIPVQQLCLQNNEVVRKIREYYDTKRRALNSLYQDFIKLKNDVSAFVRPNYTCKFDFSFELLSQYKPAIYTISTLIPLASEMALSIPHKERLMQMRQDELDKLQQDIFDTHLVLVFHITELIERRDIAKQYLDDVIDPVNKDVNLWNENLDNIPVGVALAHYKTQFLWKDMLDNLELKIKELKYVMSYYEKLKSHFFMIKTTNFIDVFRKQGIINKALLELIEKNNAIWWSNMGNIESFLTSHNLLSDQLVTQYQLAAQQYRIEKDKNPILFAKKKQDDSKKLIKKESDDTKKRGGGGPEDPEDPDDKPPKIIGYFKNVFTHAFTGEKGHLIDTPANRILILEMVSNIKNFIIKDVHGNYWYAQILKDGRQLWAWARDGFIRDCGINDTVRAVTKYGLCRDVIIK